MAAYYIVDALGNVTAFPTGSGGSADLSNLNASNIIIPPPMPEHVDWQDAANLDEMNRRLHTLSENIDRQLEALFARPTIGIDPDGVSSSGSGGSVTPPSGSTLTVVVANATQTITSSTTLTDDLELFFPILASGIYLIEGTIWFTAGTNNGVDTKFAFTYPSGTFSVVFPSFYDPGATAISSLDMYSFDQTASATPGSVGVLSTATVPMSALRFSGILRVGVTAGNFKFQWAQNASSGTGLVRKIDSHMRYQKLS